MKKEDYTILFTKELVRKDHPRIILRGKIDDLRASFLYNQILIKDLGEEKLFSYLDECSNYMVEISKAEALNECVKEINLFGFDENTLHRISHSPKKYVGIDHLFNINASMPKSVIILNKLRTEIREVEIECIKATSDENDEVMKSLQKNLNRLSSAVYVLMIFYAVGLKEIKI